MQKEAMNGLVDSALELFEATSAEYRAKLPFEERESVTSISLPKDYKMKFLELQRRTNRAFGKDVIRPLFMRAIDLACKEESFNKLEKE